MKDDKYDEGSESSMSSVKYTVEETSPDKLDKDVADAIKLLEENEILWVEPNGSINIESIDKKLPN